MSPLSSNLGDQLLWNFAHHFSWGIYGGVILVMLVYILTLGALTQPRILFSYGSMATSLFVLMSIHSGYGEALPLPIEWIKFPALILVPAWFLSSTVFASLFLDTRNLAPQLHRWLPVPLFSSLGLVLFEWAAPGAQWHSLGAAWWNSTVLMHIGLLFGAAILAWRRGRNEAGYYLPGHGLTLIVVGVLLLSAPGSAGYADFAKLLLPLVVLLEMMLLAAAFARRLARIRQEHEARENLVRDQRRFTDFGEAVKASRERWDAPMIQLREILDEAQGELSASAPTESGKDSDYLRNDLLPRLEHNLGDLRRSADDVRQLLLNASTAQPTPHD